MKIQASMVITSTTITGIDMESQLGLVVDKKWNKGEVRRELSDAVKMRTKIIEKNSGISVDSKLKKNDALEMHIENLMFQLQDKKKELKDLSKYADIKMFFSIFSAESPPTFFEKDFIKFLADINSSLDIDLYYFD